MVWQNLWMGSKKFPAYTKGPKSREATKRASSSSLKGFFFFVSRLLLLLRDSKMVLCFCGNVAVVRTSWTSRNPGRRFYACPKMGSRCGFLGWFDPPMCQRSTVIIPGLLRTMNRYEVEVGQLKMCLLASWVLFMLFVLFWK
uniref:GRF-type domain-containing protein n=1 Tax=Lactuca sativa TaxID=4236 RepID=A0A9R1UST4_LACSA|nr:hypothetical protein LSAT_V11C800402040 [Lactuca sativa]